MNFITGFPRSGLAWLANYFYYGDTVAVFEGLAEGKDEENFAFLSDYEERGSNVIMVDHSLPLYQDMLIERYPDARWVIIERTSNAVRKSIERLGVNPGNALAPLSVKMDELRGKVNPLSIPFHQLTNGVMAIAEHFGLPYCNPYRHEMLIKMNVQYDFNTGQKELAGVQISNLLNRRAEPPKPSPANAEAISLLSEMCQGQPLALSFLLQSIETALVWDHVVDGDTIDIDSTNRTFENLLTAWPNNEFVRLHAKSLTPVMASAISKWKSGDRDAHYSVYADLATAVAFILGGMPMVNRYLPRLRKIIPTLIKEDDTRDYSHGS